MDLKKLSYRSLRHFYRKVDPGLYRRLDGLAGGLDEARQSIDRLQSELAVAHQQLERASHDVLWAREEAKQLRDLLNEQYGHRAGRVGDTIRTGEEITAIHTKIRALAPWQGPYDFGSGVRACREPPGGVPAHQRYRFDQLETQDEDFFRRRATRLFHAIRPYVDPKNATLVDVGCADGFFSIAAARHGYKQVIGLDVRPENIERARYAAELFGLKNIEFKVDNVYELDTVRSQRFDVVICQGVMYHLTHPILALQKLVSITRTVSFIAGWTAVGEGAKFDLRTDDVGFFLDGDQQIIAIPTYEGLRQAMKLVGFKNVLEVVRPGLEPTGEWREFLGFQ